MDSCDDDQSSDEYTEQLHFLLLGEEYFGARTRRRTIGLLLERESEDVWILNAKTRSVYIGEPCRAGACGTSRQTPINTHDDTRGKLLFFFWFFALYRLFWLWGLAVPTTLRVYTTRYTSSGPPTYGRMSSFKSRLPTDALFKAQRGVDYSGSSFLFTLSLSLYLTTAASSFFTLIQFISRSNY